MITIGCDICGRQRARENCDDWLLGFDTPSASAPGGRDVKFLGKWEQRRALDPGAVHVCGANCRDQYIENARAAA